MYVYIICAFVVVLTRWIPCFSSIGRGKSKKALRIRAIRLDKPIENVRAGFIDKVFLAMLIIK